MELLEVRLPRGVWHGENVLREAALRPLSDEDAVFLAVDGRSLTPFERSTALLKRCLAPQHAGDVEAADLPLLHIGDREALLLHLFREAFGSSLPCVLACPDCGEPLEFDVSVEDLLVQPAVELAQSVERITELSGMTCRCTVRPPTAGDVEAVLPLASIDPDQAADELFARCVTVLDGVSNSAARAPAGVASSSFDDAFEELDPQAETLLSMRCAACRLDFQASLDAGEFVARTALNKSAQVFRDVHELALHYHWSESDILALAPERRRMYLQLIADEGMWRT